jgi:hypothetical protein
LHFCAKNGALVKLFAKQLFVRYVSRLEPWGIVMRQGLALAMAHRSAMACAQV